MLIGSTLVEFGTVELVYPPMTGKTLADIGARRVDAPCVHVAMISV